jgi:EAL domain-containing protein (putative c-di-GMP-specific phosphodiesterase class I)
MSAVTDPAAEARPARGERAIAPPPRARRPPVRRETASDLARAIVTGELLVMFQPIFALGPGRVVGFEALLRWRRRNGRTVPPALFIPAAEDGGVMPQLGGWVLEKACRVAAAWPRELFVSVNISPAQFDDPTLCCRIHGALARSGLPASRLRLEITERLAMRGAGRVRPMLWSLQALGARVWLDDFGSGYADQDALCQLAFDGLKLDRAALGENPANAGGGLRAALDLARSRGLDLVVEGVERPEQLAALRGEIPAPMVQGHLIAPPMDAAAIGPWLQAEA